MICRKCGAEIQAGTDFCMNCGERQENCYIEDGVKPRKEYNTAVFVVLSWFLCGFTFGINDFYAGFIKMGIYRTVAPIIGIVIMVLGANAGAFALILGLLLIGSCMLIGVWELFMLPKYAYMLENGDAVFIRNLDKILDKKGVEKRLMMEYGCSVKSWKV